MFNKPRYFVDKNGNEKYYVSFKRGLLGDRLYVKYVSHYNDGMFITTNGPDADCEITGLDKATEALDFAKKTVAEEEAREAEIKGRKKRTSVIKEIK